jgi:hypothetical protein
MRIDADVGFWIANCRRQTTHNILAFSSFGDDDDGMSMRQNKRNKLRLAHRDVRITRGGFWFGWRNPFQSSAAKFVEAIISRYEGKPWSGSKLDRVLRNTTPMLTMQSMYQHTDVRLAPRLELTLMQRLLTRRERIKAVVTQPVSPLGRSGSAQVASPLTNKEEPVWMPPARPVPRVFRRPATVATTDRRLTTTENVAETRSQRAPVTRQASQAMSAPIDVKHLTDQVIRTIDRRIIAQRERLGRI